MEEKRSKTEDEIYEEELIRKIQSSRKYKVAKYWFDLFDNIFEHAEKACKKLVKKR